MTQRSPLTHTDFLARRARLRGDMCAHRSARSEFRSNANVVKFECAPGTPGSDKQPASWADSYPFLIVIAVFAGFVLVMRMKGWV